MKRPRSHLRQAAAFVVSALFHVVFLALVLTSPWRPYALPEVSPPPEEVEIVRTPQEEPVPPQRLPPIPQTPPTPAPQAQPERQPPPVVEPQPQPQPQPQPPRPEPPKPAPPRVETVRPVVIPTPAAPTAARPVRPLNAPSLQAPPVLAPIPEPETRPAAPAAPAHAATPAPSQPAPTAAQLHPRKSEHEAPAGVPTLPLTPAPSAQGAPAGGRPAAGGGGGGGGGSRLEGLNPYPGGVFPGGTGLRGSLVGCANADAVSLSSVERAHCNERFGTSASTAPHLDPIAPARRSAFERETEKRDRDRAYRDSSTSAGMTTGMGGIAPEQSGVTVRIPQ